MTANKSPKIAVVGPSAPPLGAGGVGSAHYHLYRCFRKKGLDAVLLTFNEREAGAAGEEVLRFGASQRERAFLALCTALFLKARGSEKLAYQLIDIVASVPGVLRMNRALRRLKPDHIIIPDHGAPGLFLDKGRAQLTVVSHHNPSRFLDPLLGDFCPVDVRQALLLEQRALKKADRVVTPSRYMEGVFKDTFSFDGPVATIHNPLDLALIDRVQKRDVRGEIGAPPHTPLVYIPSAGSLLKGERHVPAIVEGLAAKASGPIAFYLSGPLSAALADMVVTLPERVRVYAPGHLDYAENLAVVKGCDFAVSPTLIENFGMAIVEAGFCGLPVVTFGVGGNGEIICDGENGFCVPCGDVASLVAAAARLLDRDFCAALGGFAYRCARKKFDPDAIADQYLSFCGIHI